MDNIKQIPFVPFEKNIYQFISNDLLDDSKLPDDLLIATTSSSGKLNTYINLENIYLYGQIDQHGILSFKYNNNIRGILIKKKRTKKKNILIDTNKQLKKFENQLTMIVYIGENKTTNLKIFRNGAFQITGCKNINECNITLSKLINMLNSDVAIIENKKIKNIIFVNNKNNIKVIHHQIDMINTITYVNFIINRVDLYSFLDKNKIKARYEPCNHPAVNIKYQLPNRKKPGTIMVFRSGKIIITSIKSTIELYNTYNYIRNLLNDNKLIFIKEEIGNILTDKDIEDILKEIHEESINMNVDIDENDQIVV